MFGIYEKVNQALLAWFTSTCGNNIPINGTPRLEDLAKFTEAFDCNSLQASNRWFGGWNERYVQITSSYVLKFENPQ